MNGRRSLSDRRRKPCSGGGNTAAPTNHLFISDEEFSRCSDDAALIADKADAFIRGLYNELETVKAQADTASITFQQKYALLEQKYVTLSDEFSKLESHSAQLQTSLDRLTEVQSRKHQLNLQLLGSYNYRYTMFQAFRDLVQGPMTVLEYYSRFYELIPYSEVTSERAHVIKFQSGLRPRLQLAVALKNYDTLLEVFEAAQRVEQAYHRHRGTYRERMTKNEERKMTKKNNGKATTQSSGGSYNACSSSGASGSGRFSPYACFNCGETGHKKRNCPQSPQDQWQPQ